MKDNQEEHTRWAADGPSNLLSGEEGVRAILDRMPVGIVIADAKTKRLLFANACAHRLLGYSHDVLQKMSIVDIHPESVHPRVEAEFQAMLEGMTPCVLNIPLRRQDGNPLFVDIHHLKITLNKRLCALGVFVDVTEKNRARAALEMTKQSYVDLFNTLTEAIYIHDENGTFIDVNEGAARIYRCRREDLIGQNPASVAAPGLNDLDQVNRLMDEVFRTGVSVQFDFWAVRNDGEIFPKEVVVNKGRYFGKEVLISTARDVSEKKKEEAEKESLTAQLREAQKMELIGQLAGGVAHDFNNMLGVILGNAELAREKVGPTGNLADELESIQKAAERSAALTRKLLGFARKQAMFPRPIDLNEIVEKMLSMLQRIIGDPVQLVWRPGPTDARVKMDPSQIEQILVNLCLNARDAIEDAGFITLAIGATDLDEAFCVKNPGMGPGPYVTLSVSDTGCGMDDETLSHLFEPFFTTKGFGQRSGLGLASVYGIVKQNAGCIDVLSKTGEGATVQIYWPRILSPSEKNPLENDEENTFAEGQKTILLVEDEPSILNLTKRLLEREKYHVLAAATPSEALRKAKEYTGPIHLLLTDVIMSEMNGRDLSRKLLGQFPELKRLFMSGYTADIITEQGILDANVHFLQKPFSMRELSGAVRQTLAGEKGASVHQPRT